MDSSVIKYELSTDCTCESYDEDTDTSSPAEVCWGECWDDRAGNLKYEVIKPWLEANGWDEDTIVRVEGSNMTWQRRSGYAVTTPRELLDTLSFGHQYRLDFALEGKSLSLVRYSHDEPTGASFVIVQHDEEDEDFGN
jgi:hypothetical protein